MPLDSYQQVTGISFDNDIAKFNIFGTNLQQICSGLLFLKKGAFRFLYHALMNPTSSNNPTEVNRFRNFFPFYSHFACSKD
jgi:hypothetical protein